MKKPLKILILEDNLFDAELNKLELRKTYKEFESRVVKDEKNFVKELETFQPDLILSDYAMPQFTGLNALEIAKKKCPEIPFIIVTGTLNDTTAVKCMRWGAWDYVIKDNLTHLGHAVTNAIKLKAENEKKKLAEEALRASEERYRVLFETAKDAIFITDESGKIFNINQAACKSLGYTKAELLKMRNKDLDADTTGYEAFKEVRNGLKDSITFEVDQIRKDGTLLPVEVTGNFYTIGDKKFSLAIARDLSKRRQVEKALRSAKREKEIILDSLVEHVIYENEDMKILWANKAAYESVDLTREEMVGRYCYEIWPKRSEPCPDCPVIKAMKTKKPHEIKKVTPDGRAWFIRGYPTQDEKGDIVGGIEVTFDITEHKRAEKALKESEEKLRNIFENSTNLFYSHTTKHQITYISPQVKDILGYTQEEAKVKWTEFTSDNPINEIGLKHTVKAIETAKNQPAYELELVKKSGENIWVEVREAPVVKDGKTISIVGALTDITERKKAEEELKSLSYMVEQSSEGMALADLNGNMIFSNKAWCDMHEYESPMDYLGKNLAVFHSKEQLENDVMPFNEEVKKHGTYSGEVGHITKEGKAFPTLMTSTLLKDPQGNPFAIAGIAKDITERKRAEEQIKKDLEIKNILLQEVHHRVKNNMQIVSSLLKLQSAHIKDKRALELFQNSRDRVKTMALIHDALYRSKDLSNIDFAEYVRKLATQIFISYGVNSNLIKLNININNILLDISTAIPCGLIINELVSNSFKYAFPKGRKGEISINCTYKNQNYTLIVKDNGIGIYGEIDLENSSTLGLMLVNSLTKQINGTLKLEKVKGTSFKITFKKTNLKAYGKV